MIEKDTDLFRSRQNQIEIIEKRRALKKVMKRIKEDEEDEEEDSDLHSCKQYKAKKDFESVLYNEIQKAKRKFERDESSEASEEEKEDEDTEELIKEHQLKRRRFIRNTADSESEESEPSIILTVSHLHQ
jgi:hypothetical protein